MKKINFMLLLFLVIGSQVLAQAPEKDFVIVGAGKDDPNLRQVQMRYQHKSDVYFIAETSVNPLAQITNAIESLSIRDLHIYLQSKPNAMIFNSTTVTSKNIVAFSESLKRWKTVITGKVVVHSLVVFTGKDGLELKEQLEKISGLEFTMER